MADWPTLALYWYAPRGRRRRRRPDLRQAAELLPVHPAGVAAHRRLAADAGRDLCAMAVFFVLITGGTRALTGRRSSRRHVALARALDRVCAFLLLLLAMRVYLGRFERLFDDHTIFAGVTYTDAHVTLTGLLVVCAALVLGAAIAPVNAVCGTAACAGSSPRSFRPRSAMSPCRRGRLVRQQLHRQAERAGARAALHRPQHRVDAAGLRPRPLRAAAVSRPRPTVEAADPANNQPTLQNIRLWDWHALQDTLRQIQEIRTYYDFPDIDIDRYQIDGTVRAVMLATRELNVDKLPESSRNWINEKLIYTHGYGITMNPVNGFTPEGLPTLLLSNMPVQSTVPESQGHAPGDLLRRAHQHRRLRARPGRRSSTTRRARPTTSRPTRAPAASCSAASSAACSSRSTAATWASCRSATT